MGRWSRSVPVSDVIWAKCKISNDFDLNCPQICVFAFVSRLVGISNGQKWLIAMMKLEL